MTIKIQINREKLAEFCGKNAIKKLSVFGSVLRDDFSSQSDIDVLVEFEQGQVPGLIKFVQIAESLSEFFGNRKIDLVTYKALRQNRRTEILKTAEVQYDRAA